MDYLYHYTSIETLALILSNKTLCFNNLLNVDDIEEAETSDMGKFGRFVYASCWTNDERESIPLWNLYTPDMHGVRIKLPVFPFKRYSYKKGEYFLENDVETYINIEKLYKENKVNGKQQKAPEDDSLLFFLHKSLQFSEIRLSTDHTDHQPDL